MKKLFILISILFFSTAAIFGANPSENDKNAVFLKLDDENETQNVQKGRVNMDSVEVKYAPNSRDKEYETLLYKDVNRLSPEKKSVSKNIEKKVNNSTSVGAEYSTSEKSGNMNDAVSVYSKYEKENFSLKGAYSEDRATYNKNGAAGGTVSLTPEVSLNKHVKIKNVFSENTSTNQQKSEVVLSVRPFKDDRVDLDLGAGQTFSTTNEPAKSQINIGTKIRF